MKPQNAVLSAIALTLALTQTHAAYVSGVTTTIIGISTYGRGSVSGDIRIAVENTVAGCEAGYYMKASSAGLSSSLATALSAFHAGSRIKINAYDDPRWAGSNANYCEIESITLSQ